MRPGTPKRHPNPRLDNYEKRGNAAWGLLIVPIFVMGIILIVLILRSTCGMGASC